MITRILRSLLLMTFFAGSAALAVAQAAPTPAAAATPSPFPEDQRAFLSDHKAAALKSLLAEDQTSITREWNLKAKDHLGIGKSLRNWTGKIDSLSKNAEGAMHLSIRMSLDEKNFVLFATDAGKSSAESRLIAASTPEFAFLQSAKTGDAVAFSGSAVTMKDGSLVSFAPVDSVVQNPAYVFTFTRVVGADTGIAERLSEEQKLADKMQANEALRDQASKPVPSDVNALQPLGYYRIGAVTPLYAVPPAEVRPADSTPLPPPIQVLPETTIYVHSAMPLAGIPWYNVTVDMNLVPAQKKGWISSTDLAKGEVYKMDRVLLPTPAPIIREETSYNSNADARQAPASSKPRPGSQRTVIVSNADAFYHVPKCPRLGRSQKQMNVRQATDDGFKPCPLCYDVISR